MNERRMLIDSKEALNSWGTWKTGYELQQGDVIYGVATKVGSTIPSFSLRLEIGISSGSKYPLDYVLISNYYSYNYLKFNLYTSTNSSDYYNYNLYTSNLGRLTGGMTSSNPAWGSLDSRISLDYSNYNQYSNYLPEGTYIPIYFGELKFGKYSSLIEKSGIFLYYNGGTNTMPESNDNVIFLTTLIEQ